MRKKMVLWAKENRHCTLRRACRVFSLQRSTWCYEKKIKPDDSQIKTLLIELSQNHKRWGFKLIFKSLRQKGYQWNHKKVYRVYCELNLNIRVKPKKRLKPRTPIVLKVPTKMNKSWSMDFMHDSLANGKTFRTLNIIDDYNRESLVIDADFSMPASRVIRTLEQTASWRGFPSNIRVDNGPEFISKIFLNWAKEKDIKINHIQPGKPAQNAYIERFNRTYREEILNQHWFEDIYQVRILTEKWMEIYNKERPHSALNYKTPWSFIENKV